MTRHKNINQKRIEGKDFLKIPALDKGYNLCTLLSMISFEWDEQKRLANLEKHGLDFFDVTEVFEAPHIKVPSAYSGEEERFLAIGLLEGRYVTVIFTTRSESIRIISFRRARHEERQKYNEIYDGSA